MIEEINNLDIINEYLKIFKTSVSEIGVFSHYLVYKEEDEICAFISYELIYDRIEIDYIYTKERFRTKGIASKLINYLVNEGINNNCINITLEVRESNINAINFYKTNGFKEVTRREKYYNDEDGILMIRELV